MQKRPKFCSGNSLKSDYKRQWTKIANVNRRQFEKLTGITGFDNQLLPATLQTPEFLVSEAGLNRALRNRRSSPVWTTSSC